MTWTAIVPVKRGAARKSRLAQHLSLEQREELSEVLVTRVLKSLGAAPSITSIVLLSESPDDDTRLAWHPDLGRGLNYELSAFAAVAGICRLLIIHGDLPLLTSDDVEALIAAARQHGIAIAPDRHGLGTNALAFGREKSFDFAFGKDSCILHLRASGYKASTVNRAGLSIDIDTHDDLLFAHAAGFNWQRPEFATIAPIELTPCRDGLRSGDYADAGDYPANPLDPWIRIEAAISDQRS